MGYTGTEGGRESSTSSQSKGKKRSFQSCFGRGQGGEDTVVEGTGEKRMRGQEPPEMYKDQPCHWQSPTGEAVRR